MSPDKWAQLNTKLETEKTEVEAREKAAKKLAAKLILIAIGLLGITGLVLWLFAGASFNVLAAMLPGSLFLITVLYAMRQQKLAALARNDLERIQRDIRQWKKKNPATTISKKP